MLNLAIKHTKPWFFAQEIVNASQNSTSTHHDGFPAVHRFNYQGDSKMKRTSEIVILNLARQLPYSTLV